MKKIVFTVLFLVIVSLGCNFPYQITAIQDYDTSPLEALDTPKPVLPLTQTPTLTETVTPTIKVTETPTSSPTPTPTQKSLVAERVFVPDVLDYPVVQQIDSLFVSEDPGKVTQYREPLYFGNIGILSHNYLAGKDFFGIDIGDSVLVFFEDERVEHFEVSKIYEFEQIEPKKLPYLDSDLRDLETGVVYGVTDVLYLIYGGDYHLVFQTCIENFGNPIWGLIFIIAEPVE